MAIRDTHRESPRRFPLRRLLSAERALAAALSHLSERLAVPEARACIQELHYAAAWVCAGLERRVPRAARRELSPEDTGARRLIDHITAGAAAVDQLRLVNRSQRAVVGHIESALTETLEPELRAFLEDARVILARSVRGCDDTIALLDRAREVRPGSG
jgi:hypothetical protein